MKIGVVYSNELSLCPYVEKYIEILDKMNLKYDFIVWNRSESKKEYPSNYFVYQEAQNVYKNKFKKLSSYIRFSKYVNNVILKNNYEKLIMLTTLPAMCCYKLLRKKYKKKYIFDFRDLSYEKSKVFKCFLKNIIYNSYFTCISSPGFKEILPKYNYINAHNFQYKSLKHNVINNKKNSPILKLLHIGGTRGEEYNRKLVDVFGNDKRFKVFIIGIGNDTDSFKKYIKKTDNIILEGRYDNNDKEKYISESDMLLYYYPCSFNNNRALANKYYDGIIYKKPLIGNINTYSGKRLMSKNIGISLDIDDKDCANKIYEYYCNLDLRAFCDYAELELKKVLKEDSLYLEKIEEFLNEENNSNVITVK